MKRFTTSLFCIGVVVALASCGGSNNSGGNNGSPLATLSATTISFSSTAVATSSAPQSVTLKNTGTATLNVSGITVSGTNGGDFTQTNTCGSSVAVSGNCSISVVFKPGATGSRSAYVYIADNASGSPQSIYLTGTGTAPAVSLSSTSLTYANQTVGTTSAAQSVTVTDSGTANLTFGAGAVTVSGTNAADFKVSADGCSSQTVAPVATCAVSVTFAPSTTTSESASLNFADNASNSPQAVSLSGTGIAAAAVSVSGTATKGAISGATVTIYDINSDGTNGTVIGTGSTDSSGKFTVDLTTAPTGPVRVVISAGTYSSEWDGTTVTSDSSISLIIDDATSGASGLSVTAASTFIDSLASGMLSSGKATTITGAHGSAESVIDGFYGFPAGTSLETLVPDFSGADISGNPEGVSLGLIVGTLTEEGHVLDPTDPDALIDALSADISDGVWDGSKGTSPITLGSGGPTLPTTAGTSDFESDIGTYIGSGTIPVADGETSLNTSTLVTTIETGVDTCGCTPSAIGLASSSSGAINSLSFGGHQYLFVAARESGIAVVDITDPTIANPPVKLWPNIYSNAPGSGGFGSNPVGGVAPFVGTAGHPQVLAFAYGSAHMIVLNAQTLATGNPATDNPVDAEMDLPLPAGTLQVSFSGGSAYIGSAVPLGGPLLGLATAEGYVVLDASQVPNAAAVVHVYPVDDTNEEIAENLGVASGIGGVANHYLLLGGNEDGGVQIVDLGAGVSSGTSYYVTPANFSTVFPGTQNVSVDGNSVDSAYQVGILTFEDTADAEFVNLTGITETAPSGTTLGTWAPPSNGVAHVVFGTTSPPTLSGSAVDPTTHLVLFMAGYSDDIAVGLLQNPATPLPSGSTWQGLTDWSFTTINNSPSLSGYAEATDPHADGVVYNLAKGTPYGYVLDGSGIPTGVVQIDLAGFLTIPRAGTTGDAAHQPGSDPATVTNASTGGKVMQEDIF